MTCKIKEGLLIQICLIIPKIRMHLFIMRTVTFKEAEGEHDLFAKLRTLII